MGVEMVAAMTMTIVDHGVEMAVVIAATEIETAEMVAAITMTIVDHTVEMAVVIAATITLVRTEQIGVSAEYPSVLSLGYVHQIFVNQGKFKMSAGNIVVFARVSEASKFILDIMQLYYYHSFLFLTKYLKIPIQRTYFNTILNKRFILIKR